MAEMGRAAGDVATSGFAVMGKTFDPEKPDDYLAELQDQEGVVRGIGAQHQHSQPSSRRTPGPIRRGFSFRNGVRHHAS